MNALNFDLIISVLNLGYSPLLSMLRKVYSYEQIAPGTTQQQQIIGGSDQPMKNGGSSGGGGGARPERPPPPPNRPITVGKCLALCCIALILHFLLATVLSNFCHLPFQEQHPLNNSWGDYGGGGGGGPMDGGDQWATTTMLEDGYQQQQQQQTSEFGTRNPFEPRVGGSSDGAEFNPFNPQW